ncbi:MAG: hypothetical protein LBU35_00470 [Holosporales bacterium]|nr:hypothetical protein [Holosporales bacterium]
MEVKIADFDIGQIANSGQCFRINKLDSQCWEVIAFGKRLIIKYIKGDNYIFDCSLEEYKTIWEDYFDVKRDYEKIKNEIIKTNDPYLIAAVKYGSGIRILKQDLWEVIVSFIISQRNNVPRIKNTITKLCAPYKNDFPSADILSKYEEADFKNIGLGYRAIYLKDISNLISAGKFDLEKLKKMEYQEALEYLKRFRGIGEKVANCIALFGLHKIEAFPIDIWIKHIIEKQYNGNFDIKRFESYAGIVQQYMFYYQRSL